jgi:hypothetical protein
MRSSIQIILGDRAKAHIANKGLKPEDICAIPAAAGGPKGLILQGTKICSMNGWAHNIYKPVPNKE